MKNGKYGSSVAIQFLILGMCESRVTPNCTSKQTRV